jgi:3-hydroxypropanoate dehydrogenase
MRRILNDETLDILFRSAGDRHAWLPRPVGDTILRAVWELVRLGPRSGACAALHLAFVKSQEAKAHLSAALPESERAALTAAPVVAIVACPAATADDDRRRHRTTLPEGALHAGYLMLAGRALGLDCAPIWEFDPARLDQAFFPDGRMTATFLCGLGYAEDSPAAPAPHRPLAVEDCAIL